MTLTLEPSAAPERNAAPDTAQASAPRLRMADLALLAAVAGLLGLLPLGTPVKSVLVAAFTFLGPGAAVLTWVRVPTYARIAAVLTLSMSLVTLTTITAMWSYRWNPTGILVVGAVAIAASSAYRYSRRSAWPDPRRWPAVAADAVRTVVTGPGINAPVVLTAAGLVVWAVAMPNLPGYDVSYFGLVATGTGRLLIPAVLLTTIAFLWAVVTRRFGAALFAIAGTIVVLRVTTWAGTDVPLYDWTYKHVGVMRFIQETGLITPPGTDIYSSWPAFFVTTAWFGDVTTLGALTMAHLWTPLIHVLIAVVVYSGARQLRQPPMTALMAVFVAEIANWVGQDYFSPQSWAIVLAFGALVLLLASRGAPQAGVLAIIPFAAMVPAHQLTPFWLAGATVLLVVFRRARPRWVALAMIVIVGLYLARNYEAVIPHGLFTGGNPVKNASSNMTMAGVPAKEYTSLICRALSAAVVLTAAASALWSWRTGRRHTLGAAIIAFSAFGLLLGQGYGGEAIFRVYLYSLLGCALLIAPALMALLARRRRGTLGRLMAGTTMVGILAASLASLYAFFALWPIVYETRSQTELVAELVDGSEPGTRFMMMAGSGMPTRTTAHYAPLTRANPYFDNPMDLETQVAYDVFPTDQDLEYLNWMANQHEFPTYLMFSPQSAHRMEYYGFYNPDAERKLKAALDGEKSWKKVYDDGAGTVVYRLDPRT